MARQFTSVEVAESVLDDIIEGKYSSNVAYGLLNQIINDLPGTRVAERAQEVKDERY